MVSIFGEDFVNDIFYPIFVVQNKNYMAQMIKETIFGKYTYDTEKNRMFIDENEGVFEECVSKYFSLDDNIKNELYVHLLSLNYGDKSVFTSENLQEDINDYLLKEQYEYVQLFNDICEWVKK